MGSPRQHIWAMLILLLNLTACGPGMLSSITNATSNSSQLLENPRFETANSSLLEYVVRDTLTKRPIVGAKVDVAGTVRLTDGSGFAGMGVFPNGVWPTTITADGYSSKYFETNLNIADRVYIELTPVSAASGTVSISGRNVDLVDFPLEFFDGNPHIPAAEVVRLIDIQYDILREIYNYSGRIRFEYTSQECGAYAVHNQNLVVICKYFLPKYVQGNHLPWQVFAHEMSHVMAGSSCRHFIQLAGNFSAYLDEHQAEVTPEYVYRTMVARASSYGLSGEELASLSETNQINRDIQARVFASYSSSGRPYYILQNQVQAATMTGQATSHLVIEKSFSRGARAIRDYGQYMNDQYISVVGNSPSQSELGTYVAAAWSVAFDEDLRADFRTILGYPISDTKFSEYCQRISPGNSVCGLQPATPAPAPAPAPTPTPVPAPSPAPSPIDRSITGNIDGIISDEGGRQILYGWACAKTSPSPIEIHMYLGGPAGGSQTVAGFVLGTTSVPSEPEVAAVCTSSGSLYRFRIDLSEYQANYAGQPIYIHGISPFALTNLLISGSGAFTIPAAPAPQPNPPPTPEPVVSLPDPNRNYCTNAGSTNIPAISSHGSVEGWSDKITFEDNRFWLHGWACALGINESIPLHIYVGGPAGIGELAMGAYADQANEPIINSICRTNGVNHRYKIDITDLIHRHSGKTIFVHGLSVQFPQFNYFLRGSGACVIPYF